MGSQFWWFYDVLAVAAILVMVYLSGRRGIFKSLLRLAGYFLAVVMAFTISGSVSKGIYKSAVRNSNVKKINKSIIASDLIPEIQTYIEDEFDFSGETSQDRLEKIYTEQNTLGYSYDKQMYQYISGIYVNKIGEEQAFYRRLHKCYAELVRDMVKENLLAYAAETAYNTIMDDPEMMNDLIPMLLDSEKSNDAAEYIADKCTAKPYRSIIRLVIFMIILLVIISVTVLLIHTTFKTAGFQSMGSHIAGGFTGILLGAVIVLFIAACVRLNIICGEDKMLFFNNEAVNKTYLFRHFYSFITSNF